MPYDVIIGHEFLKGVMVLMSEGCVTIFKDECELLNSVNCITGEIESLLEHVSDPLVKQEAYRCIDAYYPVQVKEAPLEGIVEKQIDKWLKDGIIRDHLSCKTNERLSKYSSFSANFDEEGPYKAARWVLKVNKYDFEVEHRAGEKMPHAEALSRNPYVAVVITPLHNQIKQAQEQDEGLTAIKEILKEKSYKDYLLNNDILYNT